MTNILHPVPGPSPTLASTPIRQAVPAAGGVLEVLVRIQAPAQPLSSDAKQPSRLPLRLALVVDRSGSMDGQPLNEAMRCVEHIVTRLQGTDQVAVVLYDEQVQVPVALQAAARKPAILAALKGVESGGSTALFDGWAAGARQLEAGKAEAISRVLLLSDGQANHGLVEPQDIQRHCAQWLAKGVSTTTVGLGHHFNEDLMIAMAQAGGGKQYYGQTAEDLYDSFDEELSLLQAMCLRQLRIKLVPAQGVIVEPLGLVRQAEDGWHALSDLAWGSESWMLVRLHVDAHAVTGGVPRPLVTFNLRAQAADGSLLELSASMLALPVVSAEALDALPQNEQVVQRLMEVQFAEASIRVRELLQQGKLAPARKLLADLEQRFAGHPWLADQVRRLQALAEQDVVMAAKELRYKSSRLYTRLAAVGEAAYTGDETNAQHVPAFLRRKGEEGTGRKR